jgi:hypothetical protein
MPSKSRQALLNDKKREQKSRDNDENIETHDKIPRFINENTNNEEYLRSNLIDDYSIEQ